VHAATVIGESDPALGDLIGGVFVSHPPQFAFTVYPMFGEHPITAGVEAFTVHDEFYIERQTSDVQVHMVAFDRGMAYPMAWSRVEGRGRIAHIAPGHSQAVWNLEPYQQLLLQALDWTMDKN
ncbi:MAG TPA: ThuA domain-containing protein, partial [Anaerolineales bacterium]|nr:ThuA domain-containing protein [Anaerolineales bacterium]